MSHLAVETDAGVARIILKRPPLNILDLQTIHDLNRALRNLRGDAALRAIVLAAEGKAFSAGVSVEDHFPERATAMLAAFHDVFRQLRRLEVPTIAAVQGAALGGGCELACFADFVFASEAASFGVPEIKLGSFPPIAVIHFPSRIGRSRTLQLILSGEVLAASEALRIGLIDRVVPAAELPAALAQCLARLKEKSSAALRLARRATLAASGADFEADLAAVERLFLGELMKTADATEGLRAFLEKRSPAWSHR